MAELTIGQQKLMQEVDVWSHVVDDLVSDTVTPDCSILLLKQTPLAMTILGADIENNLYISPKTLAHLKDPSNITPEVLKQVPKALTDPIAVFKTDTLTHFIYMLDVPTCIGSTVVADVEFNAKKSDGSQMTIVQDIYASEKDGKPDNDWLIDTLINMPAYCNRDKWSKWATEYNGGDHKKTGYYVCNVVRHKQ